MEDEDYHANVARLELKRSISIPNAPWELKVEGSNIEAQRHWNHSEVRCSLTLDPAQSKENPDASSIASADELEQGEREYEAIGVRWTKLTGRLAVPPGSCPSDRKIALIRTGNFHLTFPWDTREEVHSNPIDPIQCNTS